MTDPLRDQIAAVLKLKYLGSDDLHHHAADAVIKDLGLAQEFAYTRHPRRRGADYRYVSTWMRDE